MRNAPALLAALLLLTPAIAQDLEEPLESSDPLGPGPWDQDLVLLRSSDGRDFEAFAPLVERASDVTLCVSKGERVVALYKEYPEGENESFGRLVLRSSDDGGNEWTEPEPITLVGLPPAMDEVHEPCLVARPEGGFRMYFTGYPAGDPNASIFLSGEWPAIHSASSLDGKVWSYEEGQRFAVEGSRVQHAAVAQHGGQWHFVAPVDGRSGVAYHAVSRNGVDFRRLPEIELGLAGPWRGSLVADGGTLRFFGAGRVGWGASSADGMRWRLEPRVRWGGPTDTSVVRVPASGDYLMAGASMSVRADDVLPPGAAAALLDLAGGGLGGAGGGASIAANNRFVYVMREDVLYMFDAQTLKYLRHVRIPEPKASAARR